MKTAVLAEPQTHAAQAVLADAGGRLAAYVALTKPRIAVMVLVTVATGFLLGRRGAAHPSTLLLTLLGTGLVAGGRAPGTSILERDARPADAPDGRPAPCPAAGSRRSRRRRSAPS